MHSCSDINILYVMPDRSITPVAEWFQTWTVQVKHHRDWQVVFIIRAVIGSNPVHYVFMTWFLTL